MVTFSNANRADGSIAFKNVPNVGDVTSYGIVVSVAMHGDTEADIALTVADGTNCKMRLSYSGAHEEWRATEVAREVAYSDPGITKYWTEEPKRKSRKDAVVKGTISIGDESLGGSGGGFLVPSDIGEYLMRMMPASRKISVSIAPEDNLSWDVEEPGGDIYTVTMCPPDRQPPLLAGKDGHDVMVALMNVSFLMVSSQMAMEPKRQRKLYWQALRVLEKLGLVEVHHAS